MMTIMLWTILSTPSFSSEGDVLVSMSVDLGGLREAFVQLEKSYSGCGLVYYSFGLVLVFGCLF